MIYLNMQVYHIVNLYIRVYTRIHNCGNRTRNLVHTFLRHYHCTASVNTLVLPFPLLGSIYISIYVLSPLSHNLAADVTVGRPARAPRRRPRRP